MDQGTHFINEVIQYFVDHFKKKHTSSITIIRKVMDRLTILTKLLVQY
jgi:predicted small metal-binding protein